MSSQATKTDNTNLRLKVNLRRQYLPDKATIKVLDCYGGSGHIWKTIQSQETKKQFYITTLAPAFF